MSRDIKLDFFITVVSLLTMILIETVINIWPLAFGLVLTFFRHRRCQKARVLRKLFYGIMFKSEITHRVDTKAAPPPPERPVPYSQTLDQHLINRSNTQAFCICQWRRKNVL
jgi:hypothetical protein